MESSEIKKAIKEKGLVLGCFQQILTPELTEILGHVGFDFVVIDAEHTCIDFETIENLIRAANVAHIAPIIRVSNNSPNMVSKVLDAGAQGVMVPQICGKEDVLQIMKAVKYPPEGNRGFCRTVRATKYTTALEERPDYFSKAHEDITTSVIVENLEALTHIREIVSVEGLDLVLVGAGDLSAAMGLPGQVDHPQVIKKLLEVSKIAGENGIGTGATATSLSRAKEWIKLGIKIIFFSDIFVFVQACKGMIKELKA